MDFAALETGLIQWVTTLSGLSVVVFLNRPRPQHAGRWVALSWVTIAGVGVDELRQDETVPGYDLVPIVTGDRLATLQIDVESWDQRGGTHAWSLATALYARIRLPSSVQALAALNAGLVRLGPMNRADYKVDQRWVSRATMDLVLNLGECLEDTTNANGRIDHALVTTTLTDCAGHTVLQDLADEMPPA